MPEGELVARDLGRIEPAQLGDVVVGRRLAHEDPRRPVEVQRRGPRLVLAVAVNPDTEKLERFDLDSSLLLQLATDGVERMLGLVEEATWKIPFAFEGPARTPGEEQAAIIVDAERACGGLGVRVRAETTGLALDFALLAVDFDLG